MTRVIKKYTLEVLHMGIITGLGWSTLGWYDTMSEVEEKLFNSPLNIKDFHITNNHETN